MGRKENDMKTLIKRIKALFIGAVIFTLFVSTAEAAIINVIGNGQINDISGISLDNGDFESDLISGFDEKQCMPIFAGTVFVDYLISAEDIGQTFTGVDTPQPDSPTLTDGTFSSHILHFDPIGTSGGIVTDATFEFDAPIVGIIANTTFLIDSDDDFGSANAYNTELDRRFEGHDSFTIASPTSLRINLAKVNGLYIDELRVITKCTLLVEIDIKPGSFPNSINLGSAGVVPVAILSSDIFDATTVNPDTVSLAGASVKKVGKSSKYLCHEEDVNDDTRLDLVCQVLTEEFLIETGESVAVLEAKTYNDTKILGEDYVRIVP